MVTNRYLGISQSIFFFAQTPKGSIATLAPRPPNFYFILVKLCAHDRMDQEHLPQYMSQQSLFNQQSFCDFTNLESTALNCCPENNNEEYKDLSQQSTLYSHIRSPYCNDSCPSLGTIETFYSFIYPSSRMKILTIRC